MLEYAQQEKEMLGALMLRRDGWISLGHCWFKPGHNTICHSKTARYAERPPMNRRRRRSRRRGRDSIPAGHSLTDRRTVAELVRQDAMLCELALFGAAPDALGGLWKT